MNKYGALVQRHFQQHLATSYRQILSPTDYFWRLGNEIESEINDLADHLAGPDRPGESTLAKIGRLNAARLQAEEAVLADYLPDPSQQEEEAEDPDNRTASSYRAFSKIRHRAYHDEDDQVS